jgi:hypothetical protein
MTAILIATARGCLVFREDGETAIELDGRAVGFVSKEREGSCLAIVDEREIWRRDLSGSWSLIAKADIPLESLTALDGVVFAGGMNGASMLRVEGGGTVERLASFDVTPGREAWFAGGPPLGVRSMAAVDGAILAGVHVGGIPRSVDVGASWQPTIPVMFDVHELCVHPSSPGFVAAACAVGLCLSHDGGATWKRFSEGLDGTSSLAVAVLADEVLFSVQDGPFAKRSQVWRWRNSSEQIEVVRDGLPEWFEGRVDTGHIAAGGGRAAIVDDGGNLWRSDSGSVGWRRIASGLGYVYRMVLV